MKKFHVCVLLVSTTLLLMTQPSSQAAEKGNAVGKLIVGSIEFDSGGKKRSFKDKKLLEKLEFETGDDVIWAEHGRDNLEKFYHEKGFAFAQIDLKTEQLPDGKMKLTYKIDEGPKVGIGRISIRGNNALKSEPLKQALKTTGKKWFFWSKNYLQEELTRDLNKLKGIYWDKGFLAHTITYSLSPDILDPAVIEQERTRQMCKVDITFEIEEGPVYTVEKILINFIDDVGKTSETIVLKSTNPEDQQARTENQTFDEKQLRARVKSEPAQIYSERTANSDTKQLRMLYGVNGFINARIKLLRPVFIPDTHAVNMEFEIFEGRQYRIGRIDITGNKEAQDKVIRRILDEYDFVPSHLYNSGIAPKEGGGELEKKIQRMTLAEEVTIAPMGPAYGPKDSKVLGQDAEVNIKEGLTGNIWPGVGVSSDHGFVGQLIYDERNFDITDWPESIEELIPGRSFRGAGQSFKIGAEPGTELSQYSVSFGDPYWGGEPNKPIRLGVTGSSWERYRESYDEERIKGYVGFEKRYNHGLWFRSISFRTEEVDVGDIDTDAPIEIKEVEGGNFIAGIKLGIERNSTDDEFMPSKGSIFDVSYEQVGGDHSFGILKGAQRWYRTLHEDLAERKTVLSIKLLGATTIDEAPPFEKFYGGGTGTYGMRGFDYRGVSTRGINTVTSERDDPIGSDWIFLANAEVTVPLTGENFAALFFIDSGTVDSGSYRAAAGAGIQILIPQWFGPVPMRFELAAPIMKDDDDDTQVFSFSVGKLF
ncbi:MAG: BamA/TamA family outer membrane protein [Phycisphaerae bacterium]|nr:BamA/TamA family outer membrane protein [Phycisphaerae bacterium]